MSPAAIRQALKADPGQIQWIVNAYLLLLGSLVLIGGSAGDRWGRRRMFVAGVALFALASLACVLASSVQLLIAAPRRPGPGRRLRRPRQPGHPRRVVRRADARPDDRRLGRLRGGDRG
ncbi:MFS transporter [Caulobacter segnis]